MSGSSNIVFRIKNYRCFSQPNYVDIPLGEGVLAFVGPNNSGKSTALKVFWEISNILDHVMSERSFHINSLKNCSFTFDGAGLLDVEDPEEIFCNFNQTSVELEVLDASPKVEEVSAPSPVTLLTMTMSRHFKTKWNITLDWKEYRGYRKKINDHVVVKNNGEIITNGLCVADARGIFEKLKKIRKCMYISSFRNAINQGGGGYYGLSMGTDFINTWDYWKNGVNQANSRQAMKVEEDVRRIMRFKSLQINATPDKKTLKIIINGKPYLLREVGAGLAHIILVLANAAVKCPEYVLIDEPENGLHPALQIDFMTTLSTYASSSVFFSTHSIGLAKSIAHKIYSIQKNGDIVRVKPFEATSTYAEFLGEMSFSTHQELGYKGLLLVEGVNDVKTIKIFLRKLNLEGVVAVFPISGDTFAGKYREQELEEIKRIANNIWILADSEKANVGDKPNAAKQQLQKHCGALNIPCLLTELRAIENYFSDAAVKRAFGDKYRALTAYEKLSDLDLEWGKPNNWKVAEQMDMNEIKGTDLGRFLLEIEVALKPSE